MVYCGKPSKGCAPCRAKRTKCDLKFPVCSQCVRTGRSCFGYRQLELTDFRDDSQDVSGKSLESISAVIRLPNSPTQLLSSSQSSYNSTLDGDLFTSMWDTIPQGLNFCPDDGASTFFFNEYVLEDYPKPRDVHYYISNSYAAASPDSALANIVIALGMAGLSNSMEAPELMMQANFRYAKSLKATNSALRDPIEARSDQTLLVVMLLGYYEEQNITTTSVEPWTNHVKGALALLDYRGQEQLSSPISLQLIRSLRTQVIVNCLVRRVEVPETILKWARLAREYEDGYELAESQLAEVNSKFCSLQATMESCEAGIDPSILASFAFGVDAELAEWYAKWESEIQFTTIDVRKPTPGVYANYWHCYTRLHLAVVLNHYRCLRALVNQIIITQLTAMIANLDSDVVHLYSSTYNEQLDSSKQLIVDLSHEICASIPFHLDFNHKFQGEALTSPKSSPSRYARAKLVLWPLYVAGQSEYIPDSMWNWLIDQLEELSVESGTHSKRAKGLAMLVRARRRAFGQAWRQLLQSDNS